jgi:hypothetical protein
MRFLFIESHFYDYYILSQWYYKKRHGHRKPPRINCLISAVSITCNNNKICSYHPKTQIIHENIAQSNKHLKRIFITISKLDL